MSVDHQGQEPGAAQGTPVQGYDADDIYGFREPLTKTEVKKGDQKRTIFVHEKLVCSRSEPLDSFFNDPIIDSDGRRKVSLDNVDPNLMLAYIYWLYFRRIHCENFKHGEVHMYEILAKLYLVGEEYKDRAFQEVVRDTIVDHMQKDADSTVIKSLYDSITPESPARQLLADIWRSQGKPEWLRASEAPIPVEFLADGAQVFMDSNRDMPREMIPELDGRPVSYHELAADESKEKEREEEENEGKV